jgi:para-nitrobenzyl esterase
LISAQYAKAHNASTNAFVYYFNNAPPGRNSEFYGSFHSADLWYFFDSLRDAPGQRPWTDADFRMADTMSTYLAKFIRTGIPNGNGLPAWPQPVRGRRSSGSRAATLTRSLRRRIRRGTR